MSDWIKLRSDLDTDPRVFAMAEHLRLSAQSYILTAPARDLFGGVADAVTRGVLRDVTISALCRVWFAANRHTTDGIFLNATLAYLDSLAQVPGFGQAMAHVGYALHDPAAQTVTLPRFAEYNVPNKNGQRSKTKAAERNQRYRDNLKLKAAATPSDRETGSLPVPPPASPAGNPAEKKDAPRDVSRDVSPSLSSSISNSDSDSKSDSDRETGSLPVPPPASPSGNPASIPDEPLTIFTLDTLKPRINALRPAWTKMPAWSYEEDAALLEALPNLQALDPKDWLILGHYMKWANSTANQGRDAHKVTSRRHLFLTELASYLDRATAHWKQSGSPRLSDSTKPTAPAKPPPPPAAELPPAKNAAAFGALLSDYAIQRNPTASKPDA